MITADYFKAAIFLANVKKYSYLVPTLNPSQALLGGEPAKGLTLGSQRSDLSLSKV